MTELKIYCNANCKYNKGHCTHPENLEMGRYGGIDRMYVDKCELFKLKEDETDAEDILKDILKDILEEEEHEKHIEELVLNAIEEGETE